MGSCISDVLELHIRKMKRSETFDRSDIPFKSFERKITIVKDTNGNAKIIPYKFVYLGYPFVESDYED